MRAGKLRHRILLQELTDTFVSGQKKSHWVDTGVFWADVQAKSASEPNQDQSTKAYVTYEVTMRYRLINSNCRLIWNGKVLNVSGPAMEDPRKTSVMFTCIYQEDEHVIYDHISSGGVKIQGE